MIKKFIFLDFDGVLHPVDCSLDLFFNKAKNFFKLIENHELNIVITSSWQFDEKYNLIKSKFPEEIRKKIIGETQVKFYGASCRLKEIEYFLAQNHLLGVDWIAIDDQKDKFPHNFKKLILCSPDTGISDQELDKIKFWILQGK